MIPAGAQAGPQQQAGASFKPAERMIHMLVVAAVEQRQLLRAVGRVVGAVEIQDQIRRMRIRPVRVLAEPLDADGGEPLDAGPLHGVLEARQRRLRSQRGAAIAGDHLEGRVMPQPVRIVDVFVPRGDLVEPLADKRGHLVRDVPRIAPVRDTADHLVGEPTLLVKFAHQEQAGIGRERAAREIDDKFRLESKAKLRITVCSHRTSSVGIPSRRQIPRKYHDFRARDGVLTYSFVNYPG